MPSSYITDHRTASQHASHLTQGYCFIERLALFKAGLPKPEAYLKGMSCGDHRKARGSSARLTTIAFVLPHHQNYECLSQVMMQIPAMRLLGSFELAKGCALLMLDDCILFTGVQTYAKCSKECCAKLRDTSSSFAGSFNWFVPATFHLSHLFTECHCANSNKCHASSNRCLTSSNKKLVVTSATLVS